MVESGRWKVPKSSSLAAALCRKEKLLSEKKRTDVYNAITRSDKIRFFGCIEPNY